MIELINDKTVLTQKLKNGAFNRKFYLVLKSSSAELIYTNTDNDQSRHATRTW